MKQPLAFPRHVRVWAAAAVLMLAWTLALTSLSRESPTFDEQGFLVRGLAYLRGDEDGSRRIRVGHPLGLNALNALLLVRDDTVLLPIEDPSWQESNFHRPAELFLWEIGNDVEHVIFLARVPTLWLGLLLAAVGGRWAAELTARWSRGRGLGARQRAWSVSAAALLALVLLALDPNLLAHGRLATTDLGLAAAACLAGYALWRFATSPSLRWAVLAGAALGLLQNTKFTALLFVPLFGLVLLVAFVFHWRRGAGEGSPGRFVLLAVVAYPLSALLALWASNGFQVGTLPAAVPMLPWLGGRTLPLSAHLEQLLDIGGRLQVSTPAFLLGRYSDSGWWVYFPVAFILKTPLPILFLFLAALVRIVTSFARGDRLFRGERLLDLAALLIPSLGYFAIALTSEINLGYRHLLPVLPYLYVLTAAVITDWAMTAEAGRTRVWLPRLVAAAAGWLILLSVWIYPHFLAFFNVLAGGPDNGWRALVDSNIDWGQDLPALARWQDETGNRPIWLSYFGEARPAYYGIDYTGLESFPPRLMNPLARPFVPSDPAPGWYAISATTLQGVHFDDHDLYRYFRERTPDDKLGYSIFLYDVPARGERADVLLSGIQPDEIAADDFALLGTNDVVFRWIDGRQAVLLPTGDRPRWLIESTDAPLAPVIREALGSDSAREVVSNDTYRIVQLPQGPAESEPPAEVFEANSGRVSFLGAGVQRGPDRIQVQTRWRQEGEPAPVKIYVHLVDSQGALVSQWDGLGVAWEGWRDGDILFHMHDLRLPEPLSPGTYRLVAGLYHPETLDRWRVLSGAPGAVLAEFRVP
jgi:hypothetical protein